MFRLVAIVSFLLVCQSNSDNLPERELQTLQLVHIIFRHGNRTPLPDAVFPSDPHKNEKYYPYGPGELNLEGKKAAYNLGIDIRERYNHYLPEVYYPPDVKAYSSNISRAQMTLQTVLAAMYPPIWPNVFLPYLMWQPISYEIFPSKDDKIILTGSACPQIYNLTTKLDDNLHDLCNYVTKNAGKVVANARDLFKVYNTILVEKENGFEAPSWAEEILANGKFAAAALTYWQDIIDQKLRLTTGPFIKKITNDSELKIKNETQSKIFLYSGHDLNIASILGAFDSYDKTEIEYTSRVYIELHKIDNVYGIKVFFKNGPSNPLKQLKFKSCQDDICKFENFVQSTQHLYTPEPQCQ